MRWIRPSDFRSRKAFLHAIQSEQADIVQTEKHQVGGRVLSHPLQSQPHIILTDCILQWSNVDLDPSPQKDRTWNSFVYLAFWLSRAYA